MIDYPGKVTITASVALSATLGSIHAFSIFVPQWEQLPGASRADVSLIYSVALASLTVTVLLGYKLYWRVSPPVMFAIAGISGAAGLLLSATASSLVSLYLCYGLLFGGANGLGYGYTLQLSGQAAPSNRALAMGLVTAFYAVGATVAPVVFLLLIDQGGNALALTVMGAVLLVVSLLAALMVKWSNAAFVGETHTKTHTLSDYLKRNRFWLWVGYGCAVSAGLMIIGHSYGIAVWAELEPRTAALATTIVAFGNMLGGFSVGFYADRFAGKMLISRLPVMTSIGLLLLIFAPAGAWFIVLAGLSLVGYCYGSIIALYPITVTELFGPLLGQRVYGQIFTAWGLAGIAGPWVSGWMFDQTASYSVALVAALVLSVISVIAVRRCQTA